MIAGLLAGHVLRTRLGKLSSGALEVRFPDGQSVRFGEAEVTPVTLRIRRWRFLWSVATGGDMGFAESYLRGEWTTGDLTQLLTLFARNREAMGSERFSVSWPRRSAERVIHWWRRNTPRRSRHNVAAHYDLGNDFFELFLDSSLTYSCAIFEDDDTLERGQRRKIDAIIAKARVAPGLRILEIGSGWGSMAVALARDHGCHVTTITQSSEQLEHVRQLAEREGLADRIDVQLCDYRCVRGDFDRIVSVEMLEAVGHENLATYFQACARLLRRGGLAVVQVITIQDQLYASYRGSSDFIRRYIFPGGHLPSMTALCDAVGTVPGLRIEGVQDIGPHYIRTLREWRERFRGSRRQLEAKGYDERFQRMWEYYFAYCEAGFRAGMLADLHMVIAAEHVANLAARDAA
jgi:cyclopropane-fatty-acyl-phospholipid synthase